MRRAQRERPTQWLSQTKQLRKEGLKNSSLNRNQIREPTIPVQCCSSGLRQDVYIFVNAK